MKLDDIAPDILLNIGKAHYFVVALVDLAMKQVKNLPLEVALDAKAINERAIAEIAAFIEERRGEPDRDAYLKEITSIFPPKKRAKKSERAPAVKRARKVKNEPKKA